MAFLSPGTYLTFTFKLMDSIRSRCCFEILGTESMDLWGLNEGTALSSGLMDITVRFAPLFRLMMIADTTHESSS